jgi:DNA-binding NtrC family response regulator/tetratricopeptide (TPR) repeat protein
MPADMKALADLLGDSPGMRSVRERIARLLARPGGARRLPPILVHGETGTGKGLVARMIHRAGPRPAGPFVDVNCAAIPDTLLEAEMFGFERGAFTDARRSKPGLLQAAHRGTIFLDEVGLLPEALQAKLLKVLEDRVVRRLGATRDEPVDVWIVTATNEDLATAVQQRRFREDLYHRLAVLTVALPPLRERVGDVIQLAEHFLARTCADYGVPRKTLSADARAALVAHRWPGNVRELSNVLERAVLMSAASEITAEALGLQTAQALGPTPASAARTAATPVSLNDAMREHLLEVLTQTSWNISRTAALLGISRNTLRARMDKYGLREGAPAPVPSPRARATASPGSVGAPPVPAPVRPVPAAVVASSPPPPPTSARRWERRRIALLRAALVPAGGPDAQLETGRTLELVLDKIRSFGGRIEGLGPIGAVAVFGLTEIGDAADRAGHSAMAIVKAVERARREDGAETAVKVGIHVGVALIGVGPGPGSAELDMDEQRDLWPILDELVERASLGSILVTDTAASLLMRRFELTPSPGPPDEARAHVLIGLERTGLGLGGRLAQFVGRRQELDLLQSRLALAANGRGQVVGIVGDAGIGKSRLVFEFHQSEGGRVAAFLLGHCHAWGAAAPYLPVLEILRASCGIAETDTAEDVVVKLGAATRAMGMGDDDRDVLAQFLGMKIDGERPVEADPRAFKARTFEALRQLTIRRSRQGPLVVLLEDVHWIDRASEEYFTSLVDALVGTRIILVCTYRAGYRPPWIDKSFATQVALQPLGRGDGLSLARATSGAQTLDAALLETIAAKAEGNPFFVEELVRAVREQGGESTAAVPATIEEVLCSRLDRLEPLDQRLLQHAAVIGRQVPLSLFEALAAVPPDALRSGLGRLSSAEFLYELPRGFELEYCFKHALTHEVVYASLEASARRTLHARVVEVVERMQTEPGREVVDRLAHHAYHGGLWDKAVGYLREAGSHAAARGAHREAVADYEQALAALAHLPTEHSTDAIDLRFDLRTSLLPLGEHGRIFDVLREAEVMADAIGDRGRLGRACAYLTNAFFISSDQEQGLAYGRRALAIADTLGDFPLQAEAKLRLGQVHHALGEYPRAIEMLSGPVDALRGDLLNARFGLPLIFSVGCRTWLARALSELGQFELGLQRADEAVNIAAAAGHTYSLAVAHWSVGYLRLCQGELDQAIEVLTRGAELARTWGIEVWITRFASALGLALARSGRIADAVPLLERAVTHNLSVADQASFLAALAEGYGLAGRPVEAQRHAERALEIARLYRDRGTEAWVHRLCGDLAAGSALEAAATSFGQALVLADELQMRPLVAHAHLGLGRLAAAGGKRETALSHLTTAWSLYTDMQMTRGATRALGVMTRLRWGRVGRLRPDLQCTELDAVAPGEPLQLDP